MHFQGVTTLLHLIVKTKFDIRKTFSVLKGPLLSEGKLQTIFKTIEKFTFAMYVTKNLLQLTKSGLKFFKKVQAKQK